MGLKEWLYCPFRQSHFSRAVSCSRLPPGERGAFQGRVFNPRAHGHLAKPGVSLLFLDEIQLCPQAIMALRYFKELMPDLAVIATGSLMEFTLMKEKISWPVGRVEFAWMYPMSIGEFIEALGNPALAEAIAQDPFAHANFGDAIHATAHE